MAKLGTRELRALLDCVREIRSDADVEGLPGRVMAGVQRVVPSDSKFWTDIDTKSGRISRLVCPAEVRLKDEDRLVAKYLHQHPVYAYAKRTGDDSAHTIADFVSLTTWRRGPLYNEMYRPRQIEAQISFTFSTRPGHTIGVILNRDRPQFREHERTALNLLRPHLLETYRDLEASTRARRTLAQTQSIIEDVDFGIVALGADRRIQFANERARRAVARFFGDNPARGADALPDEIERWLRYRGASNEMTPAPCRPLLIERNGRQLTIRVVRGAGQGLLVLTERSATIDLAPLIGLGLTQREAEVLSWLAQGKTDGEIGTIIGSRPKTVGKHLERIYRKLGVETRTAAVARAFEIAS